MKLHILLDHLDAEKIFMVASKLEPYADAYIIGSLPLLRYGIEIVDRFRKEFPHKIVFVETKIVDRGREIVSLASQNGADWISVMSGARKEVIHAVASKAHDLGKKLLLDLVDSSLTGQEALEAASLGVDGLLFTYSFKQQDSKDLLDRWHSVKDNTNLPIFFAGLNDYNVMPLIREMKPQALIISKFITDHETPEIEIQNFIQVLTNHEIA